MENVVITKDNLSERLMKRLIELDELMGDLHWDSTHWIQLMLDLRKHFLMVVLDDEKNSAPVVAFCLFLRIEEEGLAHLLKVVVDPNYRKKGLGEQLLKDAFGRLSEMGFPKIYLEVAQKNPEALKLYEKLQFIKLHHCRNFYGLRRDAFKMMLELVHKKEDIRQEELPGD